MSYTKNTWVTGDIVTAAKLNNIENGVEANDLNKLNKPSGNGTAGQLLISNGDGSTSWTDTDTTLEESGKAADAKATGDAIKAVDANLAAPYSTSATYAVGDYCTKDGQLYRCTTAISTAEAWTSGHWSAVALGNDTRDLRSALTSETEAREAADEALEASVTEILTDYAQKDGTYEDLTSGNAEVLLSDVYTENSEPYFFRKTGGNGNREYLDKIVGGSLVWNQLASLDANNWGLNRLTMSVSGTTITGTATSAASTLKKLYITLIKDHVYYASCILAGSENTGVSIGEYRGADSTREWKIDVPAGSTLDFKKIFKCARDENRFQFVLPTAAVIDDYFTAENVQLIDLTYEFGTTIVDYIYSLETATAGAGIAWLRQYIDIDSYHPYSAPTLKHVEGLQSHDTTGLNQWNEDWEVGTYGNNGGILVYGAASYNTMIRCKTPIRVLPNTTYVFYCNDPNYNAGFWVLESEGIGEPITGTNMTSSGRTMTYTTTAKATHLVFATRTGYGNVYKHDVSVHIRGNGAKDEVYEPYQKHSYPLDSSVVLRGVPTLFDGRLKFDGDEYLPSGTVKRNYDITELGELNWTYVTGTNPFFQTTDLANLIADQTLNLINALYTPVSSMTTDTTDDKAICAYTASLRIRDTSYSDAASFKASLAGKMLVYKKAASTSEQAEPFRQLQICDTYGTEEFVTTSEVPVGTETRYPEDLKSKIEGLPWNLSMIAPIENGTTASQAYTAGQYFLHNNVFCKALANIASGATFTLGTNYTETTIGAELYTALH